MAIRALYDRRVVSALVIRLLGAPEIERDGSVVAPPRGQKAWAVLAYVILAELAVTRTRLGLGMVSEYASYRPPTSVGMTMLQGPWFFERFGAGWRFAPEDRDGVPGTAASWKYTYTVRPAWLRPVAEPIGQWLLGREIRARIAAFSAACDDDVVLASARADLGA